MKWSICQYFHARNDFGYFDANTKLYSRSYTTGGQCYAERCRRKGICMRRLNNDGSAINSKSKLEPSV